MKGIDFIPEKMDLYELVFNTINQANSLAEEKNIELFNKVDKGISVNIDSNMIYTVLRNLVSNAIKFSYPENKVEIYYKYLESMIVVCVKDYGVGIPDNFRERLFCIKENISTKGTNNEKGTGLGLIIAKEFIDYHNGRIWVESKPNEGSTFYFTVPVA